MENWKRGALSIASSCGIGILASSLSAPVMARELQGQCRQVNEDTFIYRTRSQIEPLSALTRNERVTLGEEVAREGWIAVTSPTTGFVLTQLLANCTTAAAVVVPPYPTLPPAPVIPRLLPYPALPTAPAIVRRPPHPVVPRLRPTLLTPPVLPTLPPPPINRAEASNDLPAMCRRVIYSGPEGIVVRSGPGLNFDRVGGVIYNDLVTVEPRATQIDREGRQWLKLRSPINGWSANGFPTLNESNFGNCPG